MAATASLAPRSTNDQEVTMFATPAAQLVANDVVFTGHGFGEAPAFVVSAARFTRKLTVLVLAQGDERRALNVASDQVFDRAPRVTESTAGLPDYDFARDAR